MTGAGGRGAGVCIAVPCITVDDLTRRCVAVCAGLYPCAEIIVLADTVDAVDGEALPAKLVVCGDVTIGAKRNRAARESLAPVIAFLDSDAYPAPGWLEAALAVLEERPGLIMVGGPNVSPHRQTRSETWVGRAHRSPLVSGSFVYRKVPSPARTVDHLPSCNLVLRRRDYLAVGGMNEHLFVGEDVAFSARWRRSGGIILYRPDVLVHHRDRSLKGLLTQRMTYGAHTAEIIWHSRSIGPFYQAAPAVFVAVLASGFAIPVLPWWGVPWGVIVALYGAVVVEEGVRVGGRLRDWPGVVAALVTGNLAPAIGFYGCLLRVLPSFKSLYRNDA